MVDNKARANNVTDLPDYEDYVLEQDPDEVAQNGTTAKPTCYTGVHSTSFKDMLLKPELLQSITDCGFEHPSDV